MLTVGQSITILATFNRQIEMNWAQTRSVVESLPNWKLRFHLWILLSGYLFGPNTSTAEGVEGKNTRQGVGVGCYNGIIATQSNVDNTAP